MVRRYTTIAAIIDILSRKELPLLDPSTWEDRNDRHFMNLFKSFINAKAMFAACCTSSNETYHHWHVFAGRSGAYLEFDRAELEAHLSKLRDNGHQLMFGPMKYFTLDRLEEGKLKPSDLPFAKRWGFNAEAEYRIIAVSGDKTPTYPVSLPLRLVKRVVVNFWLPESVFASVKTAIKKIDGCSSLNVVRSQLIDNERWKVAGIRVVLGAQRRSYSFSKSAAKIPTPKLHQSGH
jgi:hypothetical protein